MYMCKLTPTHHDDSCMHTYINIYICPHTVAASSLPPAHPPTHTHEDIFLSIYMYWAHRRNMV